MSSARATIVVMMLIYSVAATAFSPGTSTHLRSDEYDAVALIYNSEIDALGQKALYPVCISLPAGDSVKPLIQYLQRARYPVSEPTICEPALSRHKNHQGDYPHGLRIFVSEPHRAKAALSLKVESADLTLRPGEHVATSLRKGRYDLKRKLDGTWEIVTYAKD
jgi:hypothetical protein